MSARATPIWVIWFNLSLLVLYPIAWVAPLMQAGLLPLFGMERISVITGLRALWHSDVVLAVIVAVFALLAPMIKTIGLALVHFGRADAPVLPALAGLGKLAMADVFLIALYVTLAKGIGIGRVETLWGLYLFTACILGSILVSFLTKHSNSKQSHNR